MIARADDEEWLAKRLGDHGLHAGLTSTESRRERLREAITKIGSCVIVGPHPHTGKPESYEAAFTRIYGVPFEAMP